MTQCEYLGIKLNDCYVVECRRYRVVSVIADIITIRNKKTGHEKIVHPSELAQYRKVSKGEMMNILEQSVDMLGIRKNARVALKNNHILTIGDLLGRNADQLLELYNFGYTSLTDVRKALAKYNLALKGDDLPNRTVIILRGCPGSGKSTWARQQLDALVLSTDEFWGPNYNFEIHRIGEAHDWNKIRFVKALVLKHSLVIVDNTNLSKWEPKFYREIAEMLGYKVEEKLFFGEYQSTKPIPPETIERMRLIWNETLAAKGITSEYQSRKVGEP